MSDSLGKDGIQVLVKNLNNKTITITLQKGDTIDTLKQKIKDIELVNPEDQRLIFAGKQLESGNTIDDYGICNGSTIFLALRLRGG